MCVGFPGVLVFHVLDFQVCWISRCVGFPCVLDFHVCWFSMCVGFPCLLDLQVCLFFHVCWISMFVGFPGVFVFPCVLDFHVCWISRWFCFLRCVGFPGVLVFFQVLFGLPGLFVFSMCVGFPCRLVFHMCWFSMCVGFPSVLDFQGCWISKCLCWFSMCVGFPCLLVFQVCWISRCVGFPGVLAFQVCWFSMSVGFPCVMVFQVFWNMEPPCFHSLAPDAPSQQTLGCLGTQRVAARSCSPLRITCWMPLLTAVPAHCPVSARANWSCELFSRQVCVKRHSWWCSLSHIELAAHRIRRYHHHHHHHHRCCCCCTDTASLWGQTYFFILLLTSSQSLRAQPWGRWPPVCCSSSALRDLLRVRKPPRRPPARADGSCWRASVSSVIPPAPSASDMSCLNALPVELVSNISLTHTHTHALSTHNAWPCIDRLHPLE